MARWSGVLPWSSLAALRVFVSRRRSAKVKHPTDNYYLPYKPIPPKRGGRFTPLIGCCQSTTARKTPAISTRKCSCQKLANRCPTLGQLPASRILYALWVGEKQYEIAKARFCTQGCSKVSQLLVNSSPTPRPMGSCRGLPCSSPLATPDPNLGCGVSEAPCFTVFFFGPPPNVGGEMSPLNNLGGMGSQLSGSNATPLVSRYSCRATLVSHFPSYVFSVSHENCATPLKVSQKKALSHLLGGVSLLKLAMHIS